MDKRSYFDVGRGLTAEEWRELKLWRKENPFLTFKTGDPHPTIKSLVFRVYAKVNTNGEWWVSPEKLRQLRDESNKRGKAKRSKMTLEENREIYKQNYRNIDKSKKVKSAQRRHKERMKSDPTYALKINMRAGIKNYLNRKKLHKPHPTKDILGIDPEGFKNYIQSKFEPWMNWANYGSVDGNPPTDINQCWDMDHIIPLSSAKTEEELFKLFHYTNIQPLCSFINRNVKRDSIHNPEQEGLYKE